MKPYNRLMVVEIDYGQQNFDFVLLYLPYIIYPEEEAREEGGKQVLDMRLRSVLGGRRGDTCIPVLPEILSRYTRERLARPPEMCGVSEEVAERIWSGMKEVRHSRIRVLRQV